MIRLLIHLFLFESLFSFYSSNEDILLFKLKPLDHSRRLFHVRLSLPRPFFLISSSFWFFLFFLPSSVSFSVWFFFSHTPSPLGFILVQSNTLRLTTDPRHSHLFSPLPLFFLSISLVHVLLFLFFCIFPFFLSLFLFSLISRFQFRLALHIRISAKTDPRSISPPRRKCFCEPVLWSTTKRHQLDVTCESSSKSFPFTARSESLLKSLDWTTYNSRRLTSRQFDKVRKIYSRRKSSSAWDVSSIAICNAEA